MTGDITHQDVLSQAIPGRTGELRDYLLDALRTDRHRPTAAKHVIYHAWSSDLRPVVLMWTSTDGVDEDPTRSDVVEVATALERRAGLLVAAIRQLQAARVVDRPITKMLEDELDGSDPKTTVAVACATVLLGVRGAKYGGLRA